MPCLPDARFVFFQEGALLYATTSNLNLTIVDAIIDGNIAKASHDNVNDYGGVFFFNVDNLDISIKDTTFQNNFSEESGERE